MATYIIGDVQGCYGSLQALLNHIEFNPQKDRLGFVGDLVNRGPQSVNVLRFVKNLNDPLVVLGNHDLYALILGYGLLPEDAYDHTLDDLLQAPDKTELLDWLRQQPLVRLFDNALMVHAGIPPQWTTSQSLRYADEVHQTLRSPNYADFLRTIFGNEPTAWDERLTGQNRLRYIVNAFLRMRLCDEHGKLDLEKSGHPDDYDLAHTALKPWFEWRRDNTDDPDILFGHWAALGGNDDVPHCKALDTGCVWGNCLTALRLEDQQRFSVSCSR